MLEKFVCGWFINSFLLLHLLFIDRSRLSLKLIALPILAIPYLGTVFYLIIYVWEIPPPISKSFQRKLQEKMIRRDITNPGELIADRDLSEEYVLPDDIPDLADDEHSDHEQAGDEFEHSDEPAPSDEKPMRSVRRSPWIRVTMFALGVAMWGLGIMWIKIGFIHPLFLFGGVVLIYLALLRWNKF